MLEVAISIAGIFLTIFIIVGLHEFGHFIVARLVGVKVLRFSIGFGKSLLSRKDKSGTEYVFAAIPLGGYVKMADEGEGEVTAADLPKAFNRQPIYKKILIVAAGPLFNFLIAIVLYWFLFMIGFTSLAPVIGKVKPHSVAAVAGLQSNQEIMSIDDTPTTSWMSVAIRVLYHSGNADQMKIVTQNINTKKSQTYLLNLADWHMNELKPDPIDSLGIVPFEPEIPMVIGVISPDSPAAKSPLKLGDKVLAVNQHPMKDWLAILDMIQAHPESTLTFTIERHGKKQDLLVTTGYQREWFFKKYGFLGIAPEFHWPANMIRHNQYSPIAALGRAWDNFYDFTYMNLNIIGKLMMGRVSVESLGGPISIFESAGSALNEGIAPFMSFLAFISISIGVINIFPIPGLDGGHVLFQVIEAIIRRPIPPRVLELSYRLGVTLLFTLVTVAIINDILRL